MTIPCVQESSFGEVTPVLSDVVLKWPAGKSEAEEGSVRRPPDWLSQTLSLPFKMAVGLLTKLLSFRDFLV